MEVEELVTALRGARPDPGELASLVSQSGGNPLYLRFFALGNDSSTDLTLQALEIRAIQSLPPEEREITSYLALSPRPLSLVDLHTLVGGEGGPEAVAEKISVASGLLRKLRGQIMLVHEHLRATIFAQLRQDSPRLSFFSTRLGGFFENTGRHLAAFNVYCEGGEHRHADRVIDQAANQAMLMGGGAPAIPVIRRQEKLAQESGDHENRLHALLSLASAFRQTGKKDDSTRAIEQARITADKLNNPAHLFRIKEVEIALNVENKPRSERIGELQALRKSFTENGDSFHSACTGLLLTTEYISCGDYPSAEEISREVIQVFNQFGDEHGSRFARLNLAAALKEIEGMEEESAEIAQQLHQELRPEVHQRERAALCNYLSRQYRDSGELDRAEQFAHEAIQIGEALGDRYVITINRVNLGNIRRDGNNLEQALVEYRIAEKVAVEASMREEEAFANEVIASVHNELGEFRDASYRAQHAAALASLEKNSLLVARAQEELAIAQKGRGNDEDAINSYVKSAKSISTVQPGGSLFIRVIADALNLCIVSNRMDLKFQLLKDIFLPDFSEHNPFLVLYNTLPRMADTIAKVDQLLPIFSLSMADLLENLPPLIERRIILQAVDFLLQQETTLAMAPRLNATASILMAQSGNALTLDDVADISERLAELSPGIYFKPQSDGSGHWTLRLKIADGVIVSLLQADDSPNTASTTTVLALLLSSPDETIRRQLLDFERIPRHEAVINVVNRRQIEAETDSEPFNLGEMANGFLVHESPDVTRTDQPPLWVVCADQFPTPWRPHEHALSDIHLLLSELIRVLVAHLLARTVEPEVLFPKISSIIRKIGYQGPSLHAHPREGLG